MLIADFLATIHDYEKCGKTRLSNIAFTITSLRIKYTKNENTNYGISPKAGHLAGAGE
jgi:hypothetical protein